MPFLKLRVGRYGVFLFMMFARLEKCINSMHLILQKFPTLDSYIRGILKVSKN